MKKVCTICGKKVVGSTCLNPKCQNHWEKHWEKVINKKIADYEKKVEELADKETNSLTLEEYSEIRKIKLEVKKWESNLKNSPLLSLQVSNLLHSCQELENKFPEKIRLKFRNKGQFCSHANIYWKDFFQKEKTEDAYCLECGEDTNSSFAREFQWWYCKKIEEWLTNHGLNKYEFSKFLKKKNYEDIWWELKKAKFEEDFVIGQYIIWEACGYIEDYCHEFAREKGIKINNPERERERERERAKKIKFPSSQHFSFLDSRRGIFEPFSELNFCFPFASNISSLLIPENSG